MKVDVVIPTKDPSKIHPALMKTLKSAEWVNKIIIETSKPLSIARVLGAKKCSTKWIAMFDDDVVIPENWFDMVSLKIKPCVLAISTPYEDMDPHIRAYQKVADRFRIKGTMRTPMICNLLIRRDLLLDYNPPPCFSCEDEFLYRHVRRRGKWLHTKPIGVKHWYKWKDGTEIGWVIGKYGVIPFFSFLRLCVSRFVLSVFAVAYSRTLKTVRVYWRWNVQIISGYLRQLIHKAI